MKDTEHFDLQNIEFSNIKSTSEVSLEIKISKIRVTKDIEVSKKDSKCIKVAFEAFLDFRTCTLCI